MTRLLGIDISTYQDVPDVGKLNSSGLAFCWVKATEGNTWNSTSFISQYNAIGTSALLRGSYHLFHGEDAGGTQAQNFINKVGGAFTPGDLPPMIDVELALPAGTTAATALQNLKDLIAALVNKFGVQPIIYTYVDYWKTTLANATGFSACPLWLAKYSTTPPVLVGDWTTMTLWQYSQTYMANIFATGAKNVDGDYFYGSISDLWNLAGMNPIGPSTAYQPKVVALQSKLTAAGYNTGGADGIFGPNTATALAAWQTASGLPANGTITADQWMALFGITNS